MSAIAGFWLGLLKPANHTAHDVVARARKALNIRHIGHSGTLDPAVTGVMLLAVGKATRLIQYLQGDKLYRGTVRLGITTHSQDASGQVLAEREVPPLSQADLEAVLQGFIGPQEQVPPMVSAVSVNGQRLYQWARRGIEIENRPRRRIWIYALKLLRWETPCLEIEVHCSAGTYIRTLAHDLGERLGCGAHLQQLCRIAAHGIPHESCLPLDMLVTDPMNFPRWPLDFPLQHLPALRLSHTESLRYLNGQIFQPLQSGPLGQTLRIYGADQFLGVGHIRPRDHCLKPDCVVESSTSVMGRFFN